MPEEIFILHTIISSIIKRPQFFKDSSLFWVVVVSSPFRIVMGYLVAARPRLSVRLLIHHCSFDLGNSCILHKHIFYEMLVKTQKPNHTGKSTLNEM